MVNWGEVNEKDGEFYCWPRRCTKEYTGLTPKEAEARFWEPHTNEQYDFFISLTSRIIQRHKIPLNRIVRYCDIAPRRKVDPGPIFDWERFKSRLSE